MSNNILPSTTRTFFRNKFFFGLNIFGLILGITTSMLLMRYVIFEHSYDKFHENYDSIYRITYKRTEGGQILYHSTWSFSGLGPTMKEEIPEVEDFSRIFVWRGNISNDRIEFYDQNYIYASPSFLKMFSFSILRENKTNLLDEPNMALISRSAAEKYFGDIDPLGKTIKLNGNNIFEIVAIFEDVPENSHMKFDFLFSYKAALAIMGNALESDWRNNWVINYVQLKTGSSPDLVEKKLNEIFLAHRSDLLESSTKIDLYLQPIKDIHLTSKLKDELEENGDKTTVTAILAIAILILFISWANFINLSAIKVIERAKEVGIRKVLGSSKLQLIKQFIVETFSLNTIAFIISIFFVILLTPLCDDIVGKHIYLMPQDFWTLIFIFTIILITGSLLSSFYPAFILSSFRPLQVLKGSFSHSFKGNTLRKVLIVFQFFISISILISVFIIYKQMVFMKNQDLGYNMDEILVIKVPKTEGDSTIFFKVQTFIENLEKYPQINLVTSSKIVPGRQNPYYSAGMVRRDNSQVHEDRSFSSYLVDYNFIPAYNIRMLAGRNFSRNNSSFDEKHSIILDEASMKQLDFRSFDEAIDTEVFIGNQRVKIIGVINNFAQQSLNNVHSPTILKFITPGDIRFLSIRINPNNSNDLITLISTLWKESFSNYSLEHFFLKDYFNVQYDEENRLLKILGIFSIISLLISSLGVFGLTYFEMIKRAKEISIRKLLGSTVSNIILLMSRSYFILLGISYIISIPIVYYIMSIWLNNFSLKIDMTLLFFLIPLTLVILILSITIGYNILKFATSNPIKNLKHE